MIYLSYVFRDPIPTMSFAASLYSIKIFPVYIGKKVILSNKILLIYSNVCFYSNVWLFLSKLITLCNVNINEERKLD